MPNGDLRLIHKLHAKNGLGVTLGLNARECPNLVGQRLKNSFVLLHLLK